MFERGQEIFLRLTVEKMQNIYGHKAALTSTLRMQSTKQPKNLDTIKITEI